MIKFRSVLFWTIFVAKSQERGTKMSKIIVPETCFPELKNEAIKWLADVFGLNPEYDPAMQPTIDQYGLPWFRAAALVMDDKTGKMLLVHESRVNIKKVKDENFKKWLVETGRCDSEGWTDGDGGWNIPAGRIAQNESFEEGLAREIKEETGHSAKLLGLLYVRWEKKYMMPTYLMKSISSPESHKTAEISETCKFSIDGIRALNDAGVLRSPESVMDSINVYNEFRSRKRDINQINPWPGVKK